MRKAEIARKTNETDITLTLETDGRGRYGIDSGCNFFNHMLELFTKHGGFDLDVVCKGDAEVDFHHSIEDIGICLGKAFLKALGDKKGVRRYGDVILPMDEALILCAVDFSGRAYLNFDVDFPDEYRIGDMDAELIEEFLRALTRSAEMTVHVKKLYGSNNHHIAEGIFKALGRAVSEACAFDARNPDTLPSTKGTL